MENGGGTIGLRHKTRSRMVEEFIPSSGWTEDGNGHYLLVDLPEFKKEEVKLQVDNSGHITVSGERRVRDNKYSYFEKTHKLPENADVNKITGKFDGEILYVTVPKKAEEKKEEPENETVNAEGITRETEHEKADEESNHDKDEDHDDDEQVCHTDEKKEGSNKIGHPEHVHQGDTEKCEHDAACMLKSMMGMLSNNKGIVITAMFAFSVGVLVSRKFG